MASYSKGAWYSDVTDLLAKYEIVLNLPQLETYVAVTSYSLCESSLKRTSSRVVHNSKTSAFSAVREATVFNGEKISEEV